MQIPVVIDVVHEHGTALHVGARTLVVAVDAIGAGARALVQLDDGAHDVVVESPELARIAQAGVEHGAPPLLAALANAMPAAARIASLARAIAAGEGADAEPGAAVDGEDHADDPVHVVLVCAGARDAFGVARLALEDSYCAGVVVRLLLDELDAAVTLTDAAGVAISLTSTYADARSALSGGAAGRALEPPALADAAQRDLVGAVPTLVAIDDATVRVVG